MKTKIPKGWKRVRPGNPIQKGDRWFSSASRWRNAYRFGEVVESDGLIYIRKNS